MLGMLEDGYASRAIQDLQWLGGVFSGPVATGPVASPRTLDL